MNIWHGIFLQLVFNDGCDFLLGEGKTSAYFCGGGLLGLTETARLSSSQTDNDNSFAHHIARCFWPSERDNRVTAR
jgi:hypothetical protein